jgi:hypothetical protein
MIKCVVSSGYLATAYLEQRSSSGSDALWKELISRYDQLITLCNQEQVDASRKGVDAIDVFMESLNEIIRWSLEERKSGPKAGKMANPSPCLKELPAAADRLAREARKHLGLWPLGERSDGRSTVFIGSLHAEILALEATENSVRVAKEPQGTEGGT